MTNQERMDYFNRGICPECKCNEAMLETHTPTCKRGQILSRDADEIQERMKNVTPEELEDFFSRP